MVFFSDESLFRSEVRKSPNSPCRITCSCQSSHSISLIVTSPIGILLMMMADLIENRSEKLKMNYEILRTKIRQILIKNYTKSRAENILNLNFQKFGVARYWVLFCQNFSFFVLTSFLLVKKVNSEITIDIHRDITEKGAKNWK